MRYTKYDGYREHELLREVDSKPDTTELEIELAKRLESRMRTSEFRPMDAHEATPRLHR